MKEALLSLLAGDIFGRTPIWAALRAFKGLYYALSLVHLPRTIGASAKPRGQHARRRFRTDDRHLMVDAVTAGRGCPPWTAVLLAAAWLAAPAHAKDEPLWEYGFGIGVLGYNDYRGAESSHVFPVPVPYLVYNGPFDKGG